MPLRFLRISKRPIGGEVVNDAMFGDVVFAHNVHGVYVFSLRVPKDCSSVVTCQLCDLVHGERVGYGGKKIFEHFLEPCSLLAAELIVRIIKITPTVRVLRLGSARVICLFGVENTDGDFFALLAIALCHVGENILLSDRIFVRRRVTDFARNDSVLQHPRRLTLADVEHLVKLLQGDDLAFHCLILAFGIDTQYAFNGSAGFALGVGIKVRINVGSRAHIAVPEPHLNNLHVDVLRHQE